MSYPGHLVLGRRFYASAEMQSVYSNAPDESATCVLYLPNPSARTGYDTRSIFKRSLTGLNSEFSFSLTSCLTKAKEPSLSYYLPIAGFIACEMEKVSILRMNL